MNYDITFCNRECANKTCERNLSCDNKIIDIEKNQVTYKCNKFC